MPRILSLLLLLSLMAASAFGQCGPAGHMIVNPLTGAFDCTANAGVPPSGAAGGVLGGTFPAPTFASGNSFNADANTFLNGAGAFTSPGTANNRCTFTTATTCSITGLTGVAANAVVSCYDTSSTLVEIIPNDFAGTTADTLVINFSAAQTGYCNASTGVGSTGAAGAAGATGVGCGVLGGSLTGTCAAAAIATLSQNLLFTDATYDIGASGATRPRDIFTSRDVTVGRNLAVGPTLLRASDGALLSTDISTPSNPSAGTTLLYPKGGKWCSLSPAGAENCTGTAGAPAFSDITGATNSSAAMIVGTGASLGVSGSGTINATSLGGSAAALYAKLASPTFTGTVVLPSGQALIAPNLGTVASGILTGASGYPSAAIIAAFTGSCNSGTVLAGDGSCVAVSSAYTAITGVPANSLLGNNTGSTANAISLTALPFVVTAATGGSGVNNGSFTETRAGNLVFSGAFDLKVASQDSLVKTMPAGTVTLLATNGSAASLTGLPLTTGVTGVLPTGNIAVALANQTSINGLNITASTGTLAVANGKTLTVSNTYTTTATDSSTVAFGAGGTVLYDSSLITAWGGNLNSATVAASTTSHWGLNSATFNVVGSKQWFVSSAGHIKNLRFTTTGTQNAGGSLVCGVYVNGSPSAVTQTVTAGATANTFTDLVNSATVAAGDLISGACQNNYSGGVSAAVSTWGFGLYP